MTLGQNGVKFHCYHQSLISITCVAMGGGSHKKENHISRLVKTENSHSEKRNGKVSIPFFNVILECTWPSFVKK